METDIFTDVVNSYLPEPHASILNGILFGSELEVPRSFIDKLKVVGLIHIVVLSGANITLMSSVILSLTKGLGKLVSLLISIVIIILFVLFVGPEPPIVRAACMGILSAIAIIFGRKYTALYSLLFTGLSILLIKPSWITSISFQLSFAATLGIILFASKPETKKKKSEQKDSLFYTMTKYIKEELRLSLSAQVFTAPIIFIYFKQISLVSPLSNIAISWAIAPLMVIGFATVMLGTIHISLGLIPAYVCYVLLSFVVLVIEILSKVPYASISF